MTVELDDVGRTIARSFQEGRRLMSFQEYFDLFKANPLQQARNTAQYVRDMFDYFGSRTLDKPHGEERHFHLFDGPEENHRPVRAGDRLIGQEVVQEEIYRILNAFVRERRVNRLILLHGPNGSAKSTIIARIMRAMKAYSRTDHGALYRFRWVFPLKEATQKGIGFGGASARKVESFAYLEEDEVGARLACEVSDHPLFLIPGPERRRIIEELLAQTEGGEAFVPSDYVMHGDLCPKCNQIYGSLLEAYHGDYREVLKHVQVERFYIEPRYREAAVTVEPQLRVDAGVRQVTMDSSLGELPASLRHLSLFSPYGDLPDGSRGIIEYNDLLKRPIEAWKYILTTCEKSTVSLENTILFLDAVFIGSTNDVQLDAFKESPDFAAFKGRIELVRTPYLLDYREEERIYQDVLDSGELTRHVAPHTARVAALWAVLTRLRQPRESEYPAAMRNLVRRLSPLQKAELYSTGVPPETFSQEEAKLLRAAIPYMRQDGERNGPYEGRIGASPRELKMVLLNAAQDPDYKCVSPLAVFEELRELVRDPTVYRFLQVRPEGDYLKPKGFIDVVKEHYLDVLVQELQEASGLVAPGQHEDLFARYVSHVLHWIRQEKVRNPTTGEYEDPSEALMEEVERHLGVTGEADVFRNDLIGRIGAWKVDHPDEPIDYRIMFGGYLGRIQDSYFREHKDRLRQVLSDFLVLYGERGELPLQDQDRMRRAANVLASMEDMGYCAHCAVDAAALVLKERLG